MNAETYPTWASIARDYLAIMGSSVSSERAFSSAGITISKRRNRLKPDIVEALQFRKSLIHHNIIFREVPMSKLEDESEALENEEDIEGMTIDNEVLGADSWDAILADEEDVE